MATFYSVEASNATASPSVRSDNNNNGVVHYYNDYIVTTSAVSATGDVILFRAGAIPNGARILKNQSLVYFGTFGTDVDMDFGDTSSGDRFWTSGDVAAVGAMDLNEAPPTATATGLLAARASSTYYDVTSNDYQLKATFKTSAPATGIYVAVAIAYVF